jgi:hypothetical protein
MIINTEELKKGWEGHFYESAWNVGTLHCTKTEEEIIKELTTFLPRHMPTYDWNLPYAEEILLIFRRHLANSFQEKEQISNAESSNYMEGKISSIKINGVDVK